MKRLFLVLMISAITVSVKAQSGTASVGGHGAGVAEITWINGKPALSVGAYGGVLLNHKFLIGAAGSNIFFENSVNEKKEKLQFNYYGLYTEYRLSPANPIHLSVGLTSAMGWQENDILNAQKTGRKDGDYTYVFQPKLAVNVKVTNFMQVQAYGSYRFTGNTKSQYYTKDNFNGASAGVGLVFGSF